MTTASLTKEDVYKKLQTIFDRVFLDKVEITPALSASEVPEWDSLTHISLLIAVEKGFNIKFRVGEVEAAENIEQFAELVIKRVLEQG